MKRTASPTLKPYNKCLSCPHRSTRCDGPRTSAMELRRWCEFMRDMKELNGLTNFDIAEKSGVSEKTIERLMALNADRDIMRETARLIENAIIGSSNQHPCYLAFEEESPATEEKLSKALTDLERAIADNDDYRKALDNIHTSYNEELRQVREEAQRKIDYLIREVERARAEADAWRTENDRKSQIIDRNWDKILSH